MRRIIFILLFTVIVASGSLDTNTQLVAKNKKRATRSKTQSTKKSNKTVVIESNDQKPVQQQNVRPINEPLQQETEPVITQQAIEQITIEVPDTTPVITPEVRSVEKMKCPSCYITPGKCLKCYGSGKEAVMMDMKTTYVTCTACKGTGICPTCKGNKMVEKK